MPWPLALRSAILASALSQTAGPSPRIANLQTGFPFSPQLGYNPTGSGDTRNPVRPDVNPAFTGSLYTQRQHLRPRRALLQPQRLPRARPRHRRQPRPRHPHRPRLPRPRPLPRQDHQIAEATRLQFRAEFFNILNHTNLQTPNAVVYSTGPTQGTASSQTTAPVLSPTAGVVTSTAGTSRQIQLSLKLLF